MLEQRPITFEEFAKDQPEWRKLDGIQRRIIAARSRNRKVIFVPGRQFGKREINKLEVRYLQEVQKARG